MPDSAHGAGKLGAGCIAVLVGKGVDPRAVGYPGMGTAGLVGPLMTWQVMIQTEDPMIVLVKIIVIQFVLPAVITLGISEFMRKKGWIRQGDMKLEL